jgi:ubiquinol-cytochrome c reductase cytochrome c1 subunit
MIKSRIIPALVAAALAPGLALAAGGDNKVVDVDFSFEGPFGTYDTHQLQRGFQVFHEVCAACHGLRYLSFRDLGRKDGPAFPEDQVKAIAALYEVADPDGEPGDTREGRPSDRFPANEGAGAPDLTLMAKARAGFHGPYGLGINQLFKGIGGPEYIYSILTGYTGEEVEQAGVFLYENTAMPGGLISMLPPLEDDLIEYAMHGGDHGEGDDHGEVAEAPAATADQMAQDVSAFLMWAAEPAMVERKSAGFRNLFMIIVLAVLLYYTNKKLWAPVKRKSA